MRTPAEIVAEIKQRQASRQAASELATPEPAGTVPVVAAVATGSNQPSEVDELAWEIVKLKLQLSREQSAAKAVIRSARRASSGQDLVLRETLLHLAREVGEPLHTAS